MGKQRVWLGSEITRLEALFQTYTYKECAALMGLPERLIKSALSRYKITSGRSGRFEKGHVPFNKGKKGLCKGGVETQFKKGHVPMNTAHDGAIRLRGDGYLYIRKEKGNWELLHHHVWKQKYGDLPSGKVIVFKNGNTRNCIIENLEAITRKELVKRNRNAAKASESMKELYRRECLRKKYGIAPLSGHGNRIVNYQYDSNRTHNSG